MDQSDTTNLTGKLLVAMPGMGDPRFDRSVILICKHSGDGAMGLIVNKPARDVSFGDLLGQLGIDKGAPHHGPPICLGGPVENARGFVLHSMDYESGAGTLSVPGGFGMTATMNILEDIARGVGPKEAILALGYSGWGPGQLEAELAENGWLVCDSTFDLVFKAKDPQKWSMALAQLGIDALSLSAMGGRA